MTIEAAVSLSAAWTARSPAILAFGGDSAIELLSATVVLWLFTSVTVECGRERFSARLTAVLLFTVAAFVVIMSALALIGRRESKPTYLGIVILVGAITVMPWLASQKRKLSRETGSAALRADAAQSSLCAYLAFIALLGLGVNAIWHVAWADPVAALVVTPLILWEGKQAFEGKPCSCD